MSKREELRKAILNEYKSVRRFAIDMGIPYSTLATALERGIDGMAYKTVIDICDKLKLNPIDFSRLSDEISVSEQLIENDVMKAYMKLNQLGKDKIMEMMEDYSKIDKYKQIKVSEE